MENKKLIQYIIENFSCACRVMTFLIDLVPGSPLFENPEKFNASTRRKSFLDYYNDFKMPKNSTYAFCHYKLNGYFHDERDNSDIQGFAKNLQQVKCLEFCFLGPDLDPKKGRETCLKKRCEVLKKNGLQSDIQIISETFTYADALQDFLKLNENEHREEYK